MHSTNYVNLLPQEVLTFVDKKYKSIKRKIPITCYDPSTLDILKIKFKWKILKNGQTCS